MVKDSKGTRQGESIFSWLFRALKGAVIGTGFIIPGVSGGVFAAIFGIYEPMIRFLANLGKDFWKNVRFFLPVGIGGIISVVLVSRVLGDFFKVAEVPLVWFFIGCVLGTLPGLYVKAGEQGRKGRHIVIGAVTCILMCALLIFLQAVLKTVTIPTGSIWVWFLAGMLMAMGALVPGLSPSNFLLYMGIYGVMMERIGRVDLAVLLPVLVGAAACFLLLSKGFDRLFERAYAGMYHFILGLIVASCIMIVPYPGKLLENGGVAAYDGALVLVSIGACVVGAALGYGMGLLEKKFK